MELVTQHAAREAINFVEPLLALDAQTGLDQVELIKVLECLGDAYEELENAEQAWYYYEKLMEQPIGPQTRARVLRKSSVCFSPSRLGMGSGEHQRSLVEEALGYDVEDPAEKGEILSEASMVNFKDGQFEVALTLSISALNHFREAGNRSRLAWEICNYAFMVNNAGRPWETLELMEEAIGIYSVEHWPRGEDDRVQHTG